MKENAADHSQPYQEAIWKSREEKEEMTRRKKNVTIAAARHGKQGRK
jgi:hypothetical protein